jgi:hypothetical protein
LVEFNADWADLADSSGSNRKEKRGSTKSRKRPKMPDEDQAVSAKISLFLFPRFTRDG